MSRRIVISETLEVAGQLADVDRLVLGDPLEDQVAPVDGRQRARAGRSPGGPILLDSIRHAGLPDSQQALTN